MWFFILSDHERQTHLIKLIVKSEKAGNLSPDKKGSILCFYRDPHAIYNGAHSSW